jgi:hypothetical protein
MSTQYRCGTERRRQAVRASSIVNGIDYLEVAADQTTLLLHLIHPLPGQAGGVPAAAVPLGRDNVSVRGGVRVTDIRVDAVAAADRVLTVTVNASGDFSTYTLSLVASPTDSAPPAGFDSQLSAIAFSFKVDCPTEFDCRPLLVCPPPAESVPQIDYLARDYASFRRLALDRMAITMPDWKEQNPADLGIALVELLAYAGDYLSYYQDAVATEAYLGTARKRVSVRRHARLVDYFMHDGANARAWVVVEVQPGSAADSAVLPGPTDAAPGTQLFTTVEHLPEVVSTIEDVEAAVNAGAAIFETLHDLTMRAAHNEIEFYTWGDEDCCLPQGATRTTLRRRNPRGTVELSVGDVLIFEEILGSDGRPESADPAHRHAVRVTEVTPSVDPLFEEGAPPEPIRVLDVAWAPDDALPFPLCISRDSLTVSVARGNVVLVDHGRTHEGEALALIPASGRYQPVLARGPLTFQGRALNLESGLVLYDTSGPAAGALRWDVRAAQPAVELHEGGPTGIRWLPQRDLLTSDRFASEFVVETEDDGRARLRFGDGVLGRGPVDGLVARYRIGNGRDGNVGAEAITRIFVDPTRVPGATQMPGAVVVRNPLPAEGGTDPETLEQVRQYAPQAFRTQERAVTEADYAAVAERHPEVQKAAATRRWTGSWHTMFLTVDRQRGLPVDVAFEAQMRAFLERFRMAGYDLEIEGPRLVPLHIKATACVEPGYFRSNVKAALLEAFSSGVLPDGRPGFFHPDNYTFGQSVYLSAVISTAMQVPGIAWVDVTLFQRWGRAAQGELANGRITLGRLEIARLDNDPSQPENGRLELEMKGGL